MSTAGAATRDDITKAMAALESNNMRAHYAKTSADALAIAASFLFDGCRVAVGGSLTLRETGIQQLIENGDYRYTSRYVKGSFDFDKSLSESEIRRSLLDAYDADVYLASANALTLAGEIMLVDGQGNRVSAIAFGPKKVVLAVGRNKLVKDIAEGFERIKTVAAPANSRRYGRGTPCAKLGYCVNCKHEQRGCSDYLIVSHQREKERIHVIIVDETLGF